MMTGIDAHLFYLINTGWANAFFDILMPLASEIGSGEGIMVLSLLPLFLAKKARKKTALLLWAGLTVTFYVSYFLKGAVARPRPFMTLPDVRVFGIEKSFSFPSTHAMQSFMAAMVASRYFRGGAAYFCAAALVAYSRVYMGVHYVTDVIGGALLGILIGYALTRLAKVE